MCRHLVLIAMKNLIKIIVCLWLPLFLQTCLVAQTITWNTLNGISGVTILGQTADGLLYAVSGTRIYTSSDAGINWVQPTPFAGTVEEFHANGNRLLVSRNLSSHYNHELFASTNDGSSWTTIFYEAVPQFNSGFRQFLQTDSGALYAFHVVTSIGSMLYRFQSGSFVQVGTTVPLVGAGPGVGFTFPTPPEISLIDHANTIYAGTHAGGLYLTRDFGTTWTQVLPNAVSAIISGPGNSVIVAADSTANLFGGVFVSSDHGVSWNNIGMKETQFTSISSDIAGNILASTVQGNYFFTSVDSTWTFVGPVTHSANSVLVTPSGVLLSASSADGIFRSTNQGALWFSNGLQNKDVSSTLTLNSGIIFVGTLGERIFISQNNGVSWQQMAPGIVGDYIYSLASSGSSIVYAGTDQGLYESVDSGNHWTQLPMQVVSGAVHAVVARGNGKIFAGTDFGVYQSTNGGSNWTLSGLTNSEVTNLIWSSSGIVYALTAAEGIYQSADSGLTWVSRGLVRDDIQTIAVNPAGQIFAGVYGGVFYSTDNGTGWAQNSFTTDYVYSLVCHGVNQIFAGTYNGVYNSYDDGNTWKQAGLQGSVILSLTFNSNDLLLAGVYQGGIFQSTQSVLSVNERPNTLPSSFKLFQNYPNPFNPSTRIDFQIPKTGLVSLKIYDLLGNEVATLLNRELSPGSYHLTWNGGNAASGVYYCRLVTATFTDVRKMMLMR